MKRLQDNLDYYNRQYESILDNRDSYTYEDYGPWTSTTWVVGGAEIFSTKGLSWWYDIKWKSKRFGMHMRNDAATREDIKQTLAAKLGCSTEYIMLDPDINPRGNEPTCYTGHPKAFMFSSYNIGYQCRELKTRFDQERYDAALKSCQSSINSAQAAISKFQQEEASRAKAGQV